MPRLPAVRNSRSLSSIRPAAAWTSARLLRAATSVGCRRSACRALGDAPRRSPLRKRQIAQIVGAYAAPGSSAIARSNRRRASTRAEHIEHGAQRVLRRGPVRRQVHAPCWRATDPAGAAPVAPGPGQPVERRGVLRIELDGPREILVRLVEDLQPPVLVRDAAMVSDVGASSSAFSARASVRSLAQSGPASEQRRRCLVHLGRPACRTRPARRPVPPRPGRSAGVLCGSTRRAAGQQTDQHRDGAAADGRRHPTRSSLLPTVAGRRPGARVRGPPGGVPGHGYSSRFSRPRRRMMYSTRNTPATTNKMIVDSACTFSILPAGPHLTGVPRGRSRLNGRFVIRLRLRRTGRERTERPRVPASRRRTPGTGRTPAGNTNLTPIFAARSSARCRRFVRDTSACVRSACDTLVPNLSVWTSMATSARTSSTPVRAARFLNASSRGLPARVSVINMRNSSASAGYASSSSSVAFTIAWSSDDPASRQTIIRSSASGRPFVNDLLPLADPRPGRSPESGSPTTAAMMQNIQACDIGQNTSGTKAKTTGSTICASV